MEQTQRPSSHPFTNHLEASVNRVVSALLVLLSLLVSIMLARSASAGDGKPQPAPREPGSYVVRVGDQTVTRLGGPDSTALLSPYVTMAAVATRSGPEAGVRVVELATSRVSFPLLSEAGQVDTPVWSPDGQFLAFRFRRFGRPDPAAVPPSGLYIVAPRTYEAINVLPDSTVDWTWAPDGRSITAVELEPMDEGFRTSIVTVDAATGAVVETVLDPATAYCPGALAWSPDGRWLVFQSGSYRQGCGEPDHWGLWLWDARDRALRRLTSGAPYIRPQWTADGRILARRIGTPLLDTIVLLSVEGAEAVLAAAAALPFPFVPYHETAGRTVIWWQPDCDAGAVFAIGLDGGDLRRLSDPSVVAVSPALAPDGRSVAWVADHPGGSDLQVAATDGSTVRTLLVGAPGLALTGWSGDGSLLSFRVSTSASLSCPGRSRVL